MSPRIRRIVVAALGISSMGWNAASGETATSATQPAPSSQPATQPADAIHLSPADQFLKNLATTPRLTGDWGGVRTALQDVGFSFQPTVVMGYMQDFRGGVNTHHAENFSGLAQYNTELDFEKMKLIPGGSFFIRGMQTWNDGIRSDVGSLSTPAYVWGNSGDHAMLVDKWWYRQRFFNDRLEFRIGKLLNTIDLFDVNAYATNMYNQFSNSWLCSNPTLPVSKGLGAFVKAWPTDWLYVQAGAMDPDQKLTRTGFDTAFHGTDHFRGYWEVGVTPKWEGPQGKLPGNYKIGWWYDPQMKKIYHKTYEGNIPQRFQTHDMGVYVDADQLIWKENSDVRDKQGLGLFARLGFADGDVDRISHAWSIGGQYEGLFPTRDHDVFAFGVVQSRSSGTYRRVVDHHAGNETVFEWYYSAEVLPWLIVTPDFQVINNPGAVSGAHDSIIGGVRIKIIF